MVRFILVAAIHLGQACLGRMPWLLLMVEVESGPGQLLEGQNRCRVLPSLSQQVLQHAILPADELPGLLVAFQEGAGGLHRGMFRSGMSPLEHGSHLWHWPSGCATERKWSSWCWSGEGGGVRRRTRGSGGTCRS